MKTKRILALLSSLALIGQITPVFAEETKDFSIMEGTSFTSSVFKEFAFVYELIDVMNKKMKEECKGIDIRSYGDKLDLENPSQSKVEVIAGNEESVKELEEFVVNQGYSKDILLITVNPDFIAEPDIPSYSEIILGDINADGKVDISDLSELSLYLIGDKVFTDAQKETADVDSDGKVRLTDLARMRQYLSKIIDSLEYDDSNVKPYSSTPLLMITNSKDNSCYVITEDGNRYANTESEVILDKELYIQNDKILQKLLYISKNATANHKKIDECKMETFTYDGGEDYSTSLYAVYYDETGTMKQLNICNIEKNLTECVDWTDVHELVRMLIEEGYIEGKDYLESLDKKDVAEPDDDISPFELAEKDLESYVQKYKYESAELDIDNDGIVEQCLITYGPTSGLRTHIISAYADGKLKYRNTFNIETHKMSFTEIDGKPCVKMDNDADFHKIYIDGKKIVIENIDPEYWGESDYNLDLK